MAWSKTALAAAVAILSGLPAAAITSFNLYGHSRSGKPLDGVELVYKDGLAYFSSSNSSEYEKVVFTESKVNDKLGYNFTANPVDGDASWSNLLLYVPTEAGQQVGFTAAATANQTTDEFFIIETAIIVWVNDIGESSFSIEEVETDVWALIWGASTTLTLNIS